MSPRQQPGRALSAHAAQLRASAIRGLLSALTLGARAASPPQGASEGPQLRDPLGVARRRGRSRWDEEAALPDPQLRLWAG
jgi:hypothetical protein